MSRLLLALSGEHAYDRSARAGNWFALWLPVFSTAVTVGIVEAAFRGSKDIEVTPLLVGGTAVGTILGVAAIAGFNATQYRFSARSAEKLAPWPFKGWSVSVEEIDRADLRCGRGGHWVLELRLRDGRTKKIPATRSMREALHLS